MGAIQRLPRLSAREHDVLVALRDAVDDATAAAELKVKERTVKFHVANMRAKLGDISRTQLCAVAALHQLLRCASCPVPPA
ncbi:LuxR C-terminal-related transcriptional regulator [Streptomyces sp. NBC_00390]|uniref:LuxR C-terminal-related transcriptional regulator n=1 Tax=Streptomyces sp. NBC_00390 TaxID=2975736 RepID=UPI003FCD5487